MIYGYARVSTKGQARDGNSLEAQEQQLRREGAIEIFADSFTGTKINRPQLDLLLAKLEPGDMLMVTKLDRLARSASRGSALIEELIARGVCVTVLNMGRMDNTGTGRLIRQIMLAFAEFERDMIVERTSEGKMIAKRCNPQFKEGRPQKFSPQQMEHALSLLTYHSYRQVEAMTGISRSTLKRYARK